MADERLNVRVINDSVPKTRCSENEVTIKNLYTAFGNKSPIREGGKVNQTIIPKNTLVMSDSNTALMVEIVNSEKIIQTKSVLSVREYMYGSTRKLENGS